MKPPPLGDRAAAAGSFARGAGAARRGGGGGALASETGVVTSHDGLSMAELRVGCGAGCTACPPIQRGESMSLRVVGRVRIGSRAERKSAGVALLSIEANGKKTTLSHAARVCCNGGEGPTAARFAMKRVYYRGDSTMEGECYTGRASATTFFKRTLLIFRAF